MNSPVSHLNSPVARAQRLVRGLAFVLAGLAFVLSALLGATPVMAAAPATNRVEACSWDHPGVNPYMGDMATAVDRYTDMPADVRARLQQRMAKRQYDEIVVIKRDSIEGQATYDPTIRDMHFGTDRVCTSVSRKAWSATQQERGLVYCEGDQCLIVPTVCRNVSRITRKSPAVAGAELLNPSGLPLGDELLFAPPGAGPLAQAPPMTDGGPIGNAPFTAGDPGAIGSGAVSQPLSSSFSSFAGGPVGGGGAGGGFVTTAAAGSSALVSPTAERGASFTTKLMDTPPVVTDTPVTSTPIVEPLPVADVPVVAVPEPGTWALMLAGLIGCAMRGRAAMNKRARPL